MNLFWRTLFFALLVVVWDIGAVLLFYRVHPFWVLPETFVFGALVVFLHRNSRR